MVLAIKQLDGIPPSVLFAVCNGTENPDEKKAIAAFLADHLGAPAPLVCLDFVAEMPADWQSDLSATVLKNWIAEFPEKAAGWFLEHELEESSLLGTGATRDRLATDLGRSLFKKGSIEDAFAFAQKVTGNSRQEAVLGAMIAWEQPEKALAFGKLVLAQEAEFPAYRVAMTKIAERLAKDDLEKGREWIETIPADKEALTRAAYEGHAQVWLKTDARSAADWWIGKSGQADPAAIYQKITES